MSETKAFVHLSINATRAQQSGWGDTQFAAGLGAAIRQHKGWDCGLLFRGEAPGATACPAVVLRIIGPHLEEPVPGMPNILWMISPPNLAPVAMLARYQAFFCGSEILSAHFLSSGVAATYLPQATAVGHFHPDRRPADLPDIPIVFVGGYAPRVDRKLVIEAAKAGFEPQIWGPGWKGVVPERLWRGERLDYDELAQTYARAHVVLNSHMANMATMGFMSNRSYDALASGAAVVSDVVRGFSAPDLPELHQVRDRRSLVSTLEALLSAPVRTYAERVALHERLIAGHGFQKTAAILIERATSIFASGAKAPAAFRPGSRLAGPAPVLTDPALSADTTRSAILSAAREILAIARYLETPDATRLSEPARAAEEGVIHPLMADLHEIQQIALHEHPAQRSDRIEIIAARARRVLEVLEWTQTAQGPLSAQSGEDSFFVRVIRNEPLWAHAPEGFRRDDGKMSLPLWPRQHPPGLDRPVGVFLHLFYDDLAPAFAARLANIPVPSRIYVSTDTVEKADRIRVSLPDAEIRVTANRGRDICPKLYGFDDAHDRHDIVLHLHGKKSLHSGKLDDWLAHILDCLLGSPTEVSRILSFFASVPRLGIVKPVTFKGVLGAAHWGANRDIAREIARRIGLRTPLPENTDLRFPVGSMFWARTEAIRPLLNLNLRPGHFPAEAGQIDGTLAHALERMLGVTCVTTGHHILPVSGAQARLHVKHQKKFGSNGALRDALEQGVFDT